MKSHGVYETPGGTILLYAHRELESLILDRETMHFKEMVAVKYADSRTTVYGSRRCAKRLMPSSIPRKDPSLARCKLKLYKGNIISAGKKSPFSLYREDFATFGQEDVYDQSHAEGFIRLYGLSMKVRALNGLPVSGLDMPKPDYSKFKRD
jgi:argininosuccinate synthase